MARHTPDGDNRPSARRPSVAAAVVACAVLCAAASAGPVVIGHRGNSSIAPENTLAAITAAVGSSWGVESDPRLTADGQIILMHDATVDRTTNGTGSVSSFTFDQIRALDAGYPDKFGSAFAGEQVPTMIEAVALADSHGMISCLDIKSNAPSLAATYVSLLAPYKNSVEIHCFNWDFLAAVEALDPGGFTLVALGSGDIAATLPTLPAGVDKLSWQNTSALTSAGIAAAHAAGIQVYAWTVNDASTMVTLRNMGIDGIVTDNTVLADAVLNTPTPQLGDGLPRRLHDGLMMNWTFDDGLANPTSSTAIDSARGLDARLGPTVLLPGQWVDGSGAKLGGALEFDGADDYAEVADSPLTSPMTNAVTISAWVKLDRLPSASTGSFQPILDSSQDAYVLYTDRSAGELRFKVTAGAAARPGIPETALDTTAWHHVVGVYDGGAGVARIYLDGQLMDMHADDGSGSDGLVGIVGTQSIFFGRNGSDTNSFFDGQLDDTAVWSRALSQTEIRGLYNSGTGRAVLAANPLATVALPVVRLDFEGNLANTGSGGATYNGALVDGATGTTAYTAGPRGQALAFNNPTGLTGGDYVRVPYTLTDAGTISFWCKPSAYYDFQTIFDNSADPEDWEMWVYSTGEARFRIESDAYVAFDLDNLAGPEEWYHMAVSWFRAGGGVVLNLYVDGLLRDVDEGTWANPGSFVYLAGGNADNDHGRLSLDDFRIFDTVLNTDEIVAILAGRDVPGDANGDGRVNGADAALLAANWLSADDPDWTDGDFNRDGVVDDLDLAILAAHWESPPGTPSVPEPGALVAALFGLIALGVVRRQRRGRRGRLARSCGEPSAPRKARLGRPAAAPSARFFSSDLKREWKTESRRV
ncbi:MAG: hypothetical protein JW809_08620 [Pirellulales bacterium]|nr:hypothetical protein [Pirellulales bacterium]